jgi:hypothetical protein
MATIAHRDAAMTDNAATLPRLDRSRGGPDRVTVVLLTLATFLAVFAILAARLQVTPGPAPAPSPRVVVLRRVYRTTIVDDGRPGRRGRAPTVSVSTSGAAPTTPPPTTRTSTHP